MIDLHSHILPGTDDGAKTLEDAVEMCRQAAADGTTTMVATPHRFDGVYKSEPVDVLRRRLAELQQAVGPNPRLVLGCELHFTHDIVRHLIEAKDAITINDGPYVLIEFPPFAIPTGCEPVIYQIISAGFRPIIAHPERNIAIQDRPERYFNLSELGLYSQIDSASLLGKFGREAQTTAQRLLECNLCHAISSDAHSPRRRRPGLSRVYEVARDLVGDDVARALVIDNPQAVVDGEPLPYVPDAIPKPAKHSRWSFFARR